MKNLRLSPDEKKLVLEHDIEAEFPAIERKGKITAVSQSWLDQFPLGKDEREGREKVKGQCVIEIDIHELVGLCYRASGNKNHKSQEGPVNVTFKGTRIFEEGVK